MEMWMFCKTPAGSQRSLGDGSDFLGNVETLKHMSHKQMFLKHQIGQVADHFWTL